MMDPQLSKLSNEVDRTSFSGADIVIDIWESLNLPKAALNSISLLGEGPGLPSSFKVGMLAQSSIALSALSAANFHALRNKTTVPNVTVPLQHAVVEFVSERFYLLDGKRVGDLWGPLGGLHQTSDGYVRIHDGFPNHRYGALRLLGLEETASKTDVSRATLNWKGVELETEAFRKGLVISALRSYQEWDALPQATAISNYPIHIRTLDPSDGKIIYAKINSRNDKALRGIKVLELSRVLAAPIAGRTLAAHGADVLWVTSPNLPDLPALDKDTARGKRTIQLDLRTGEDKDKLLDLARTADVFIQGYRPGSIAALNLSEQDLLAVNPNIIYANMSAYGPNGPWSSNRGFDSLVQTCSGMNVSEAEHFGDGSPARPLPCQALDHTAGYLLATGIIAALYRRESSGGAYVVDVSLAGVMKYLRSLGQYVGRSGFQCEDLTKSGDLTRFMEIKMSGFGEFTAVKHSASIDGVKVGWEIMPKPLGSDRAEWQSCEEDNVIAVDVH